MKKPYLVLDLFAGVGGLSFAFHKSDAFKVIAANELLEAPARAYAENHPDTKVYVKDIRDFSSSELYRDFGSSLTIDLILGGPPCQTYSTAGKRNLADPRANLFEEYARLLRELRPKAFVFENVKGLISMEKGRLLERILASFRDLGYETRIQILNAADFGAPQQRERVIVVGTFPGIEFSYPSPTHAPREVAKKLKRIPHLTLRDAVGDLPKVLPGESVTRYSAPPKTLFQKRMRARTTVLLDHDAPLYGERLAKIMKALPEGGSAWDLPKNLQPTSGFGNSYGRLWWDKPSPTITRNLGTPSSARCIHPKLPRALTTREGARLQCFPDSFIFHGSRSQKNLQIGEAVPTVLSHALLPEVEKVLSTKPRKKAYASVATGLKV